MQYAITNIINILLVINKNMQSLLFFIYWLYQPWKEINHQRNSRKWEEGSRWIISLQLLNKSQLSVLLSKWSVLTLMLWKTSLEAIPLQLQGGVTYIGAVHIAATGVKILDRPKLSLDLLTTPDLCPWPFDPSVMRMRNRLIDVILTIHSAVYMGKQPPWPFDRTPQCCLTVWPRFDPGRSYLYSTYMSNPPLLDGAEKLGDYTKFDSESDVRTTTNDWKYGHT